MDPNATLTELREAARGYWTAPPTDTEEAGLRVVELFEALDEWLTRGGFLPEAWALA